MKYPSTAVNYQEAKQVNANQFVFYGKDNYTTGVPEFDLAGTKLEIFVSAKTADIGAVTSGIKVYYQKELTTSDFPPHALPQRASQALPSDMPHGTVRGKIDSQVSRRRRVRVSDR